MLLYRLNIFHRKSSIFLHFSTFQPLSNPPNSSLLSFPPSSSTPSPSLLKPKALNGSFSFRFISNLILFNTHIVCFKNISSLTNGPYGFASWASQTNPKKTTTKTSIKATTSEHQLTSPTFGIIASSTISITFFCRITANNSRTHLFHTATRSKIHGGG